ncbi:MAG: hypothetical protein ACOCRK_10355 [bacterium]
MKGVGIAVIQMPVDVMWECPKCFWENKTKFNNFLDGIEYCDWEGEEIECEDCGEKYRIEHIEWD